MLLAATVARLTFALSLFTKGKNMDVGLIDDALIVENVICADSVEYAEQKLPGYAYYIERTLDNPFGPGYSYDPKTGKFTEPKL